MTLKQDIKAAKQQLAKLRREWTIWRKAIVQDPFRIDEFLVCPVGRNRYRDGEPVVCGDPTCEGCCATLGRLDHMTRIEAEARTTKAFLDAHEVTA